MTPVSPAAIHRVEAVHGECETTTVSHAPLRARYTFPAGGESVSVGIDGDLNVLETDRTTVCSPPLAPEIAAGEPSQLRPQQGERAGLDDADVSAQVGHLPAIEQVEGDGDGTVVTVDNPG